jgi:hypothetical protein
MVTTVTNVSGASINVPEVGEDGVALPGGEHPSEADHRSNPLPFPFSHIGTLANAATSILGTRPTDWLRQNVAEALSPAVKWSLMVQASIVTMTNAVEATLRDPYETFLTDL